MEGFLSKIPEPEVEEKPGLTAEELELLTQKMQQNIHAEHRHQHYKGPTDAFKPKGAAAKARAKKKMADKSRRRNRK